MWLQRQRQRYALHEFKSLSKLTFAIDMLYQFFLENSIKKGIKNEFEEQNLCQLITKDIALKNRYLLREGVP